MNLRVLIVSAALGLVAAPAVAAPSVIIGEAIIGAPGNPPTDAVAAVTGIEVSGTSYRVDFYLDSLSDIFGFASDGTFSTTPLTLGNESLARAIADDANAAINAQPVNIFTSRTFDGILSSTAGSTLINYRIVVDTLESTNLPGVFSAMNIVVGQDGSGDYVTSAGTFGTQPGEGRVYGVVSEVSAVPLPAGGVLLIGAIAGLAAFRRRPA